MWIQGLNSKAFSLLFVLCVCVEEACLRARETLDYAPIVDIATLGCNIKDDDGIDGWMDDVTLHL
jgi:hypothetical protein